jgi:hypothetical protein
VGKVDGDEQADRKLDAILSKLSLNLLHKRKTLFGNKLWLSLSLVLSHSLALSSLLGKEANENDSKQRQKKRVKKERKSHKNWIKKSAKNQFQSKKRASVEKLSERSARD